MKEWLLLDRIALQRPNVSAWDIKRAFLIKADLADARQTIKNDAPMAARETPNPVVMKLFVKDALVRPLRKHVFKGASFFGLGCHRAIVPLDIPAQQGENDGCWGFRKMGWETTGCARTTPS
jgi:hypothetical protein